MLIFEGDPFWPTGAVTMRERSDGRILTSFEADWPRLSGPWTVHLDPTGRYVGIASPDHELRLLRVNDLSVASSMMWGGKNFVDFRFAADGSSVVVLTQNGEAAFWNTQKGGARKTLSGLGSFSTFPPNALSNAPDASQMLAVDQTGKVVLFSLQTYSARILSSGKAEPQSRAAMSPDGTMTATLSTEGVLRIWDVELARTLLEVDLQPDSGLSDQHIAFSPDGRRVIVGSLFTKPMVFPIDDGFTLVSRAERLLIPIRSSRGAPTDDHARRLGIVFVPNILGPESHGVKVVEVVTGSSAADAGVRLGDVVTSMNEEAINKTSDVAEILARSRSSVTLHLRRGSQVMKVIVILR